MGGEHGEVRERPLSWPRADVSVSREELSEVWAVSERKDRDCGFRTSLLGGFKTDYGSYTVLAGGERGQ